MKEKEYTRHEQNFIDMFDIFASKVDGLMNRRIYNTLNAEETQVLIEAFESCQNTLGIALSGLSLYEVLDHKETYVRREIRDTYRKIMNEYRSTMAVFVGKLHMDILLMSVCEN